MEEENILTGNDSFLRDKLAIQRTRLANQTAFLAFLRTSMYFLVAGLSIGNLLDLPSLIYEFLLFVISGLLLLAGVFNFFYQKRVIDRDEERLYRYN
jgi:putative membrane protein